MFTASVYRGRVSEARPGPIIAAKVEAVELHMSWFRRLGGNVICMDLYKRQKY